MGKSVGVIWLKSKKKKNKKLRLRQARKMKRVKRKETTFYGCNGKTMKGRYRSTTMGDQERSRDSSSSEGS